MSQPRPGDVLSNLVVRFGAQVRNHCAFCKRYFKRSGECQCGARYEWVDEVGWRVIETPDQASSQGVTP